LASSFFYSSAAGRVIPILPDTEPDKDPSVLPGQEIESTDFEIELERTNESMAMPHSRYVSSHFSPFMPGSEAVDFLLSWPDVSGLPTRSRKYKFGKRLFDIALAVIISPVVLLLIALLTGMIALTSGGPVFFRQRRIGQHGQEFFIWKFRTMHPRADHVLAEYLRRNPSAREEWNHTRKLRNDPRITRLGRVLRQTSLDELPQILNVFAGHMSFVGPRPIVWAESGKYAERFAYYLAAVPGITGLWQVSGRCDISFEARTVLDETYVCKWSMARDLWILFRTPRAVVNRDGAY
jgi:lipopolysaccharide/colanic/teichoic acid biosynthesis glycosyltransferase